MRYRLLSLGLVSLLCTLATEAGAVASAELYQNQTYTYGRFEARIRYGAGNGIISSFFLWKPGSEMPGTFWNELDFEKLGADCSLQTNPLYGSPVVDHHEFEEIDADLCSGYHTYTFEWTPSYIAYLVDGIEVRRDGADTAAAFADNAAAGMQIHFNIWPGDASFGGIFDPATLPVQQFISWVQYSSFADGAFTFQWREEFDGPTVPSGWAVGNWASPKNLSTHQSANVTFSAGLAVLSLTADDATGFVGAAPSDPGVVSPVGPDASGGAGGSGNVGAPTPGAAGATSSSAAGATSGTPAAPSGAAGAADATGGAAPSGTPGTSAAPSAAPRPAASDGGCSPAVSSPAHSHRTAWLAVGGAVLLLWWLRRRWLLAERPGAQASLR